MYRLGLAYANASKRETVTKEVVPQLLKVMADPRSGGEVIFIISYITLCF